MKHLYRLTNGTSMTSHCSTHEKRSHAVSGQRRPRLACALAQAGLGLRCPLTESLDDVVSTNRECPYQTVRMFADGIRDIFSRCEFIFCVQ